MYISIIIPNFNGENIIKKNLPKVLEVLNDYIEEAKQNAEIIIVDDGSKDDSREIIEGFVKNSFKTKIKIKSFYNGKNCGFSTTVNNGVKRAEGEILVLLNTDVIPKKGFLNPLLKHFIDENVFAVGCMDESVENGKITLRGRGVGLWKRGFLNHSAGGLDKTDTLWVSGGSGAFRKIIWQKLNGLNELYNPFYWEDIDLSYRALKSGYKIFFEKQSVVRHEHETGSIKSKFNPSSVRTIVYRNQFMFVWENGDFKNIILNILYLPYHFLKALLRLDKGFFLGLFKALIKLPKVIQSSSKNRKLFVKNDKDITENIK
jgi:GT2 family glycosyltransferase